MAPDKNNERRKNISPVQLEIMVSFMEKNLDFARGKLKREESDRLWETLSKKLNAVPDGAIKEINKWKLSWYYRRRCVKKEVKQLCVEQRLGGKDALKVSGLKDMQYRILKILGDEVLNETDRATSESDDEDSDGFWTVTPCRTRSSLKPSSGTTKTQPVTKKAEKENVGSEHFAAYITDRLSKIKNEKKRKNLEDEIIDLVRQCTLND